MEMGGEGTFPPEKKRQTKTSIIHQRVKGSKTFATIEGGKKMG